VVVAVRAEDDRVAERSELGGIGVGPRRDIA
jgi:hypothetical protein